MPVNSKRINLLKHHKGVPSQSLATGGQSLTSQPNPAGAQAWSNLIVDPSETDFEAIWQVIKHWDINVPDAYYGYCGATGNHVQAILEGIKQARIQNAYNAAMRGVP